MEEHNGGANTCTCNNVDLDNWQCRNCFEEKVEKMSWNFRIRVEMPYRGDVVVDDLNPNLNPARRFRDTY